jgi:hypothetical protein
MAGDSERPKEPQAAKGALGPVEKAQIKESRATQRATGIAIVSLGLATVSAIASIVVGVHSADLVSQQNGNAEQQELVSLVTNIEQGQQAATGPNGSSAALTILGEAEEANNIIASLHSNVSSPEKFIVGSALEVGQDFKPAFVLLTSAAKEASDPRTAADSWRAAAAVLYKLNMNSQAENDIVQAKESFSGRGEDVTLVGEENNIAYTDLFDVPYQASIGQCSVAEKQEWDQATQLIQNYHSKHHYYLLTGNNARQAAVNAEKALRKFCKVHPGVLKAKKILKLIRT